MYQKLFNRVVLGEVGPFTLINYGLSLAIGIVLYLQMFLAMQARLGMEITPGYAALVAVTYSVAFALGSKLLRILYNLRQLRDNPRELLRRNGNSFYGGVGGFVAAAALTAHLHGVPFGTQLDLTFLCLPMFQIFIRLGCATYGCCFGHPTTGPAAVIYHDVHAPAFLRHGQTPLHPSQLYSILKNLVVLTVVTALFHKFMLKGLPVALWVMLYPALRFFIDFTRDPAKKPYYAGFRSSQWISMGLLVSGVVLLLRLPAEFYAPARSLASSFAAAARVLPVCLLAFVVNFLAFGISFVIHDRKRAGQHASPGAAATGAMLAGGAPAEKR